MSKCHYCKKEYDHRKGEGSSGGGMYFYDSDYICNSCYENGSWKGVCDDPYPSYKKKEKEVKKIKVMCVEKKDNIKKEIKKIEDLISIEKKRRENRVKKSSLKKVLINHSQWVTDYIIFTINIDFLKFVKEKSKNEKEIKLLYGFRENPKVYWKSDGYEAMVGKKIDIKKEEWHDFENLLDIIDMYCDDWELYKAKTKLCKLTDCYNKLKTEHYCNQCGAKNETNAVFCNQCGKRMEFKFGKNCINCLHAPYGKYCSGCGYPKYMRWEYKHE